MNIPKEIQESRIAWAANDAKRDSGLQEPQGIEKFCDLDYAGDGITEHLLTYTVRCKTAKICRC